MMALGSKLSRLLSFATIGRGEFHRVRELLAVLWENKNELPYAWNLLNHGVCDACSLGIYGLRDNVLDGAHVCMTRLRRLRLNTMGAIEAPVLADVERLRNLSPEKLRRLGRLPYPMMRRRNHKGFVRVGWQEAFDLIGRSIRGTASNEMGFFAASTRVTNEVFYVFQKLARALGTNNVDLCLDPGYRASVGGLKNTLGLGASTCSFSDVIGTDLLVLFGPASTSDDMLTAQYVQLARQHGARLVLIDSVRQGAVAPAGGATSPQAGTELPDELFRLRQGGDIAFMNGALKALIATNQMNLDFIAQRTTGFVELKASLEKQSWQVLEERAGLSRDAMERFATLYTIARSAVFIYSPAPAQPELTVENVHALVNLALARGMIGREKCGFLLGDGHSGAADCGVLPDSFPGGLSVNEENARRFSNLWRHPVSSIPGLNAPEMIAAAHRDALKFFYCMGENLLEAMSDRSFVGEAVARVPVRVHHDIVLNSSMLVEPRDIVLVLPGQTRYEQRTGGTATSTDRRIRFTPEIPGHIIGESLPDWEIPIRIGRRAMSNGELLFPFNDTQTIREEMARVMPLYRGIERLSKEGDQLQWGGPQLYKDGFSNMPNCRARFIVVEPPNYAQEAAACIPDAGQHTSRERHEVIHRREVTK
ncbi:MAG TPA: molybdopterin-dependent oxidoreductase [Candidatus Binatia bacterium]|nr:molybdopterin-dependent oxidoreductase [Candidatus Binatia bacterium]